MLKVERIVVFMFLNRCYENENMNNANMDASANASMTSGMPCQPNPGCVCPPVMECPQERVCHRQMMYEVPHIIPINTRIINHHIYRHTYQPMYTCTMEDEVCNVYDNNCNY